MPLMRIRTEIDDRPGRLAVLTAALAAERANILDLSVQVGTDGVVDEFVVDVPPDTDRGALTAVLEAAGGSRTAVVPADPRELVDEPTRVLTLVARLRADPRALPEVLADLLRADEARSVVHSVDGPLAADDEPADTLTVPIDRRRAVRLRRAGLPFTATEAARADALVRAALPGVVSGPTRRRVSLRDGTEIVVRPLEERDGAAVRAMHERCSAESRRLRYFSAEPAIAQRLLDTFSRRSHGLTLVAEGPDGSVLALAHLMHVLDPGVAETAFLIEDQWQGRGLGRALTELLVTMAREQGLVELRAAVLDENARMRELLVSFGGRVRASGRPGVVEIRLRLDHRAGRPGGAGAEPAAGDRRGRSLARSVARSGRGTARGR
ncbi:GNAT family N-acetyltransferase [Actinomadura alba]|uniref:GNAT family N-acetyltransferase n=1 Tax=Actinomadura alba TaxID=406431 RepID=A0ABR7LSH7_9ACTN|nr:GNAT family N-acetyltransferase [Actinomadura alba]MBC6467715.1 GNAT family N-acetyltransferase [Actinomadura alba]